jgi:hypothetical protein
VGRVDWLGRGLALFARRADKEWSLIDCISFEIMKQRKIRDAVMNVRVRILFKPPTEQDWQAMRSLAANLTSDPESVRVSTDKAPGWLVAEFTMPTEAQYKALPRSSGPSSSTRGTGGIRHSASRLRKRSERARTAKPRGAKLVGGPPDRGRHRR